MAHPAGPVRGVEALRGRCLRLTAASAFMVILGCGTQPPVEQRAAMLADKGQNEQAVTLLREHLATNPDDAPAHRQLIRVLALTGRLDLVKREVDLLATKLGESDPTPHLELGHAYELAHRYEDALVQYDLAADRAPRDARGPRTGGLRAARWGAPELAEPRLAEATRRDGSDARTWHALGLVRVQLDDLPGARAAYRRGLRADPDAVENRVGLATAALVEGDAAAALAEYDALLVARPRLGDAELGRAFCLLKLGRLADAERAISRAESLGASRSVARRQRVLLQRLQALQEEQKNR